MKAKKIVILAVAFVLVAAMAVAGTLAYLQATSAAVKNTFKAAHIGEVVVQETKGGTLQTADNEYLIVPGQAIIKDPQVTFDSNNVDDPVESYVFVKMSAANWTTTDNKSFTKSGLSFSIDDANWTYVATSGTDYVYAYSTTTLNITNVSVIKDNKILVDGASITEANIDSVANGADLTFKPFAIQKTGFDNAIAAWNAYVAR